MLFAIVVNMSEASKRRKTGQPPGSGTAEQESVAAPAQTWFYAGNRKTHTTLDSFHECTRHANTTGRAEWWALVDVDKDMDQNTVKLVCTRCSARLN